MTQDSDKIILTIERRSKAIPYPAEVRDDGTKNLGFRDLKGIDAANLDIPEANDSPAIRDALLAINQSQTPFFTVGCEKSLNEYQGKFWKRGYLEFSFNHAKLIADAAHYFPLFFHFSFAAHEFVLKRPIQFMWELQAARFTQADATGFSCCVWVTNGDYKTAEECERDWDEGLRLLTKFLLSAKPTDLPLIYGAKITN